MKDLLLGFLIVSGIAFWIFIVAVMICSYIATYSNIKRYKYEDAMWCNECEEDTEHVMIGTGFNEKMICLKCKEIEDKII